MSSSMKRLAALVAPAVVALAFTGTAQAAEVSADKAACLPTGGYPICVQTGYQCGGGNPYTVCVEGFNEWYANNYNKIIGYYNYLYDLGYDVRHDLACALDPGAPGC